MFNRIGTLAASATLIAIGTLALSGATLTRSESSLNGNQVDNEQEHSLLSSISDLSNLNISEISDLSKPNTAFCWRWRCGW